MDSRQYKKLQQKWDQRLKAAGFKDIESRETGLLTSWTGSYSLLRAGTDSGSPHLEAKEAYFRQAEALLLKGVFCNRLQRRIWKLHSLGRGYKTIARILGISPDLVAYHVRRVRKHHLLKSKG